MSYWLNPFLNAQMPQEREALVALFVPSLVERPGTLLYVGGSAKHFACGKMFHEAGHEITLLEAWPAYAETLRNSKYVKHVVIGDVRMVDSVKLPHEVYDYVVWLDGPEHIPYCNFETTVAKLETLTRKVVLLASPWGHMDQMAEDGNPHMEHQSHWYPEDYEALGYRYVAVWPVDRAAGHLMAWKSLVVTRQAED